MRLHNVLYAHLYLFFLIMLHRMQCDVGLTDISPGECRP